MAEAKNLMGLTADEAQNLGVYAKITGTSADAYRKSIAAGFQEYSKNNRSAVSLGATQKEVLSTSDSIRLSLGGSGKNIAEELTADYRKIKYFVEEEDVEIYEDEIEYL